MGSPTQYAEWEMNKSVKTGAGTFAHCANALTIHGQKDSQSISQGLGLLTL